MRQKYLITIDAGGTELSISERAEADADLYSLLCEESFNLSEITHAAEAGIESLIAALRTRNFYPPEDYGRRIAQAVMELLKNPEHGQTEVFFDDNLDRAVSDDDSETAFAIDDESDDEADELDSLLEDDVADDAPTVSKSKPSPK